MNSLITHDYVAKIMRDHLSSLISKYPNTNIVAANVNSVLSKLESQGIIRTYCNVSTTQVDNQIKVDYTFAPIMSLKYIKASVTINDNDIEVGYEESEEERFQRYIENKPW